MLEFFLKKKLGCAPGEVINEVMLFTTTVDTEPGRVETDSVDVVTKL